MKALAAAFLILSSLHAADAVLVENGQPRAEIILGVTHEPGLASRAGRTLRLADGPDEVHRRQVARTELGRYSR